MGVLETNGEILLTGECQIDSAEELRQRLLAMLQRGENRAVIKLDGPTTLDASLLQVLLAARSSFAEKGGNLEIPPCLQLSRLLLDAGLDDSALRNK